jgi:PPP family 3-phenylpropionic acid transporter
MVSLVLARMLDGNKALHFIALSVLVSVYFAYIISLDDGHFNNDKEKESTTFSLLSNLSLWVSIFLMQVSFGAFYSFFTIYEVDHGISLEVVSYLWSFGVLCEIVLFYFQAHVIKFDLLKIMKFSIFITAVRWLLLYLYPESLFVSYLSQSFHAFSFALYHTATLSFLYTIYENRKLASQFYYGMGFGLGGFMGSLIAGKFYGEYLFLSSAIIALLSFTFLRGKYEKSI